MVERVQTAEVGEEIERERKSIRNMRGNKKAIGISRRID